MKKDQFKRMTNVAREILMKEWDPIGVKDEPAAQDEYDSYIPTICRMVYEGVDKEKLTKHLHRLESDSMGLVGNEQRNHRVAEMLLARLSRSTP